MTFATCDGCGMEFSQEEISAYLDKVLCRKCYPKIVTPAAIVGTKTHSPYLAFALSMLLPGAGQVYAGEVVLGYVFYIVTMGLFVGILVGTALSAPRFYLLVLLALALVVPLAGIASGAHALALSRRVVAGGRPEPPSKRPLITFLVVGGIIFVLAGVAVVGCTVMLASRGAFFG